MSCSSCLCSSSSSSTTGKPLPPHESRVLYTCINETVKSTAERLLPVLYRIRLANKHLVSNTFLNALPEEEKRAFQCNTCINFLDTYGSLALLDAKGKVTPFLWNSNHISLPEIYVPAIQALEGLFTNSVIKGVYNPPLSLAQKPAGKKESGGYYHLYFDPLPVKMCDRGDTNKTNTYYTMVQKIREENSMEVLLETNTLLENKKLWNSEKHLAVTQTLKTLYESLNETLDERIKINLIWYFVAEQAFIGLIESARHGMVSTLVRDIRDKKPFEEIEKKWEKKSDPTQYLRPQALPSNASIQNAEALFAEKGITKEDLKRCFLQTSQVPELAYLWKQATTPDTESKQTEETSTNSTQIFQSLRTKEQQDQEKKKWKQYKLPPASRLSFAAFVKNVLPQCVILEYSIDTWWLNPYFFITGYEGSKCLMQWYNETNRASWYTIPREKTDVGINSSKQWQEISSIISFPHMWQEASNDIANWSPSYHKQHGQRYLMTIKGMREKKNPHLGLFPEFLLSEFHSIRSVMEAYSHENHVDPIPEENKDVDYVAGLEIDNRSSTRNKTYHFKVTNKDGIVLLYDVVSFI